MRVIEFLVGQSRVGNGKPKTYHIQGDQLLDPNSAGLCCSLAKATKRLLSRQGPNGDLSQPSARKFPHRAGASPS
jgi:hypothetical protein